MLFVTNPFSFACSNSGPGLPPLVLLVKLLCPGPLDSNQLGGYAVDVNDNDSPLGTLQGSQKSIMQSSKLALID